MQKINLESQVKQAKQTYHWMPCEIEHTGTAPVKSYFDTNVKEETVAGNVQLTSSFRGRPLLGSRLSFPDNYTGLMLRTGRLDDQPTLRPAERISGVTHWNWDQPSGVNSSAYQAFDWLKVSEQLHKPVTREQVQKFHQKK